MRSVFCYSAILFCVMLFVASAPSLAQSDPGGTIVVVKPSGSSDITQPVFPLRAAFYSAWYPTAWSQQALEPYSVYRPSLGFYDSTDESVIRQHIAAMQYGKIEAGIVAWEGPSQETDKPMPLLLQVAAESKFHWAVYYQAEAESDPSVAKVRQDLTYLRDHYGSHPGYLRIDGRFVVFVFANTAEAQDSCDMVTRWKQANNVNAYLVLKVFRDYRACADQPDGWHQYAPAVSTSQQKGFSYSISPGFWLAESENPRQVRNLAHWRANIRKMVASQEPFQLISTFNQWGEGTAIESAQEWESASGYGAYLDALHNDGFEEITGSLSSGNAVSLPIAPTLATTTITAEVVADAYVNEERPTFNYGDTPLLRADLSPETYSYLRFAVPTLPGAVVNATLQIFSYSNANLGFEVRQVSDDRWDETSLKYTTAPRLGYVVDSSGVVAKESWAEFDVTALITQAGNINLAVLNLNDSSISLASREVITSPPRLQITTYLSATPSRPMPEATLLAVGDIADCNSPGDEATAKLVEQLSGVILTLGDHVYESGSAAEFADCYHPSWGRLAARTKPAVGEHEYLSTGAAPYYDYFGAVAGEPGKGYYSYDIGSWHIVVLNTNCNEIGGCHSGSRQEDWLRSDLAAHPNTCTLAYMHHPRWSSGKAQSNDRIGPLIEALYDNGVDLMLAAHAHNYERFAVQDPAGNLDRDNGIQLIVVGTGGKNHEPVTINILPNSEVRNDDSFGVLRVSLYASNYEWEFLPIPGAAFSDKGHALCH